jgi:very-short-patch-repair endonuclease
LVLLDEAAESPAESVVRVTLQRAGIAGFVANRDIYDDRGRWLARADLSFPAHRVIIEYQGDYHRDQDQWRSDRARIARLTAAGWFVLEIAANELHDPRALVRLVRDMLRRHPASVP